MYSKEYIDGIIFIISLRGNSSFQVSSTAQLHSHRTPHNVILRNFIDTICNFTHFSILIIDTPTRKSKYGIPSPKINLTLFQPDRTTSAHQITPDTTPLRFPACAVATGPVLPLQSFFCPVHHSANRDTPQPHLSSIPQGRCAFRRTARRDSLAQCSSL